MFRKIGTIFLRDVAVNAHDAVALMILLFPLVFAVGINLIIPGIYDTTVNIAMVRGADESRAAFFAQFANVEQLADEQAVETRVTQRDSVLGIVRDGSGTVILTQGNETASQVDYAKLINVLFDANVQLSEARAELVEFGRTVPPIKKTMVNALLLFITIFAGMLIALNILEEKTDHTVRAINVSPTSRTAFILGKSMSGMLFAVLSSVACLLITGFSGIDIGQALLVIVMGTLISLMVGFVQGLSSSDIMEAAGSVKLMFLPMIGSVVGYELLSAKWQVALYWSPFYWAYRANDLILSGRGTWPALLLYAGIILAICIIVYAALAPRIRKGLQ
jgi:ABC-type multidrug transport system permease subunit